MTIYRKVEPQMWGDERFLRLSPIPPSGQSLWLYLLSAPETTILPGLVRAGRLALAESLRWTPKAFDEAFGEVFREGMAIADWERRIVWLPKALKHNPPANPNVVVAWAKAFVEVPDCPLARRIGSDVIAYLVSGCKCVAGVTEAFGKAFGKDFREAFDKAVPESGVRTQEQEAGSEAGPGPPEVSPSPTGCAPPATSAGDTPPSRSRARPPDPDLALLQALVVAIGQLPKGFIPVPDWPPGKGLQTAWRRNRADAELRSALPDAAAIPRWVEAIRGATLGHGQGWFSVERLLCGRNKVAQSLALQLLAGAYEAKATAKATKPSLEEILERDRASKPVEEAPW